MYIFMYPEDTFKIIFHNTEYEQKLENLGKQLPAILPDLDVW